MGIGSRPATCTACNKRLGRKHWYYRNGLYFCTPRCWETHRGKLAEEQAAKAQAKPAPSGASQPQAPASAEAKPAAPAP